MDVPKFELESWWRRSYKDGVEEWREDGSLTHPMSELERPGDGRIPQYRRSGSSLQIVNNGPDVSGESKRAEFEEKAIMPDCVKGLLVI